MADKSFGVKDVNLIGASGTPTIDSPNNLNINAVNVAISTDMSIGGNLSVAGSIAGSSGFVLESAKTATGSSVEFTNIPADAYEITLMFNDVSLDGSGSILVELGTSSSYITQGYTATSQTEDGSNEVDVTNAFTIYSASNYLHHGKFDINKFSNTSYTFEGQSRTLDNGGVQAYGSLNNISGTITKLKIRPANTGSGVQFDSGSINISYKTASSSGSSGAIPSGVIMLWSGASNAIPTGYVLCDGNNSTPDLRDRFIVGAGNNYAVDATGGSKDAVLVSHDHDVYVGTAGGGGGGFVSDRDSQAVGGNLDTVSIQSAGESGTNKNLPPYYALCYIMKT